MTACNPTRLSECASYTPALLESSANNVWVDSSPFSPLNEEQGFSVKGDKPTGAPVSGLLTTGGPLTVLGAVVAIVINAIYRVVIAWSFTHIGQKALKRVRPPVANSDTSTPVSGLRAITCDSTPEAHSQPRFVGEIAAPAASMRSHFCVPFSLEAPAGLGWVDFLSEGVTQDNALSPAVALAEPHNVLTLIFADRGYRGPAVTLLTGKVAGVRSLFNWCKMHLSHFVTSYNGLVRGLPVVAGSAPNYTTMPSNSWRFV